jgi:hypothetical protein
VTLEVTSSARESDKRMLFGFVHIVGPVCPLYAIQALLVSIIVIRDIETDRHPFITAGPNSLSFLHF